MKRFKNLLLLDPGPVGRKTALDRAISLARANDARLTVAGAIAEVPDDLVEIVKRRKGKDLGAAAREEERALLEDWIGTLPDDAPPVSVAVLERESVVDVLREVERGRHDLLMLAAEGELGGWFGSTATHLLRKSAVPVWVMKPDPAPKYRRVLAAVDRDTMDPGREDLNVKILELASSLAKAEGSELHIVHAWTVTAESILRNRLGVTDEELGEIAAETRRSREEWLEVATARVPAAGDVATAHLPRGDAHIAIPDLVEELDVDLIVMGTLGRTGMFGALIGNNAERILNRVQCAVLALKPDGFKSPVRLEVV